MNRELNFLAFSGLFIGPQIKFGVGRFQAYIYRFGSKILARLQHCVARSYRAVTSQAYTVTRVGTIDW